MITDLSKVNTSDVVGKIFCLQAMFPNYAGKVEPYTLIIYKVTLDPDTMYTNQTIKQLDSQAFCTAMKKESLDQINNGNLSVIYRTEVSEGATVLTSVCQMKIKSDIRTIRINKYKARLNTDGLRIRHGEHYEQTYAPVASLNSVINPTVGKYLHYICILNLFLVIFYRATKNTECKNIKVW